MIDTSGAYIPGHGTPTVILFGRHRPPMASTLRTVMGIQGEPSTPGDPSRGLVWSSIVAQVDQPGSQSEFVSVGDSPREIFHKHPWSIGGGGASELKELLDETGATKLAAVVASIGFYQDTHADEAFVQPAGFSMRRGIHFGFRPQIRGDDVRDWTTESFEEILFPYDGNLSQWSQIPQEPKWAWLYALRTELWSRSTFGGGTYRSSGRAWFDYHQFPKERARSPLSIVFAFVATHNHFVLDRGAKVFNRSSPMIKLPREVGEDEHLGLVGLLNSSTACFWMKQIFHDKGSTVDAHGARQTTVAFENFREFTGTGLLKFPLPVDRPLLTARLLDILATRTRNFRPASIASCGAPTRAALDTAQSAAQFARSQMIAYQEELDWECYRLYGLTEEDLTQRCDDAKEDKNPSDLCDSAIWCESPPLSLGQRAFEIVLARRMAAGETQTTWFERHGSTPITELPAEWPDDYRQLVQRRIDVIESNPNIRLIEQPEYKRRWNTEPWDSQLERALREWLLNRLESYFDFDGRMADRGQESGVGDQGEAQEGVSENRKVKTENPPPLASINLYSLAKLADVASKDADFMQVGELYRDDPAFNVLALVEELVNAETVPLLPVLRYKDTGLRKRAEWEKTWELQRHEDAASDQLAVVSRQLEQATDPVEIRRLQELVEKLKTENSKLSTSIPVPPKYDSKDFLNANFWRLRGKLDVPKERWISFPGAEAEDGSLMICWAGYNHLQQAQAISAWYVEIRDQQGGHQDRRLVPLLAALLELLPWIKQWHNSSDNEFNMAMGDFFEGFIKEEARQLPRPADETAEPNDSGLFPDAAPTVTYGWSLAEIQAWKPSAKRPAKRAAKKVAKKAVKKAANPKKASKKAAKKGSNNDLE